MALDLSMTDTVLRYAHVMSAILWMGLLYFFNIIGGGFMKKIDALTKKEVYPKLYLPTLFWFRWAAMSTIVFGFLLYFLQVKNFGGADTWDFGGYAQTNWGIHLGIIIALTMWFNVWFIIWPAQKEIIGGMLGHNPSPPDNVPRRAFLASRYNTYASLPMIFLMIASPHWNRLTTSTSLGDVGLFLLIALIVLGIGWAIIAWKPPVNPWEKQ
ncbi:MAG: urate hydroxylase PuuD [Euryarchaeota archaeon]|nr:urate hydroxylase PuuD [Euryarchaeota archaeon]